MNYYYSILNLKNLCLLLLCISTFADAFEWSSGSNSRPEVDRRAIAGVWRLTPIAAKEYPMKEFTVYPKKQNNIKNKHEEELPELLLMLKEDGSFQQYSTDETETVEDLDDTWNAFQKEQQKKKEQHLQSLYKGIWDYIDGNLILAADRPNDIDDDERKKRISDGYYKKQQQEEKKITEKKKKKNIVADTLLKGRVVANYQNRLQDNPIVGLDDSNTTTASSSSSSTTTTKSALDTHLSVPKGSINIGKFFYPKNHPSFFEQPMFRPIKKGNFALRQVLGTLNTAQDKNEEEVVEKFQRSDFYNKTFLLTTHPIGFNRNNNNKSKKNNDNPWSKDNNNKEKDNKDSGSVNIRVMQLTFHTNNTFSTIAGLGNDVILRGKYDIIGNEKDHLWMQVVRFGFGRSISGSVYSEGRMLSHEDAKAYWGKIHINNNNNINKDSKNTDNNENNNNKSKATTLDDDNNNNGKEEEKKKQQQKQGLEVTGSVLDGWGLEPIPVARFIMRETIVHDDLLLLDDEDDDDDDDNDLKIDDTKNTNKLLLLLDDLTNNTGYDDIEGIDLSDESNSFQ